VIENAVGRSRPRERDKHCSRIEPGVGVGEIVGQMRGRQRRPRDEGEQNSEREERREDAQKARPSILNNVRVALDAV
jgi:hypothetical protein